MTTNAYLVYWCNEGLEGVVPIGQYEQVDIENTFRVLSNQGTIRNPVYDIVQKMILRGINSQRHYELYAITTDDTITQIDIENMFDNDPQGSADTVRRMGHRLYSDRVKTNNVLIT